MKSLLAKFKVGSVTDFGNDNIEVKMTPVTSGSEENKSFSLYTPSGDCRLHITNPAAKSFFIASKEYYLTFEPMCSSYEFNVHDNSDAFREFLDKKGISWIQNEHFTTITQDIDLFQLGREFEKYAMEHNPNYKR